ncbi:MAG: hypothetical protein ABJ360_11790 [Roseobacter sp.]|uniref:hypothetical protein n=1 Tax=Tateyamaria sp. TaxID=1929288 RepID=UPI00327FFE3F
MTHASRLCGKAALVVAFLVAVTPGFAADSDGRYSVEGPGRQKCSSFLSLAQDSREYAISAGYVSGYLSASNALASDTFDITPWQTLELSLLQIRQFCEGNPEASLAEGMVQYTAFLMPWRIASHEDKTSLRVGEKVVVQYQSVIERMRASLKEKGFGSDDEPLDGLKDYQLSIGVEPTGLPDQSTLTQLFSQTR